MGQYPKESVIFLVKSSLRTPPMDNKIVIQSIHLSWPGLLLFTFQTAKWREVVIIAAQESSTFRLDRTQNGDVDTGVDNVLSLKAVLSWFPHTKVLCNEYLLF